MEIVPFVYFAILSLWIFKRSKGRIDIAFIISSIYAISAFFGILLIRFQLDDVGSVYHGYETPEATFVYCGLLTLCLFPFIKYPFRFVEVKPISDPSALRTLAIIGAIWFVLIFLFAIPEIQKSLLSAQMGNLTNSNKGEETFDVLSVMPVLIRWPMILLSYGFSCSWVFVFLAFFIIVIQKQPKLYFLLFILASLYSPMLGILGGDRSKTTYWLISLLVCYFFFKPYMQRATDRYLKSAMTIIGSFAVAYLVIVTLSRFGTSAAFSTSTVSGSQGGLIVYLGQPYINFCYFYEEFSSGFMFLGIIFPLIFSVFVPDSLVGGVAIQEFFTDSTGVFGGVFYTYIGQIMLAAGFTVAVVFCVVYSLLSYILLKRFKRGTLFTMFAYLAFASVMFLGLFVHFYTGPKLTSSLLFFIFLIKHISYTPKIKK